MKKLLVLSTLLTLFGIASVSSQANAAPPQVTLTAQFRAAPDYQTAEISWELLSPVGTRYAEIVTGHAEPDADGIYRELFLFQLQGSYEEGDRRQYLKSVAVFFCRAGNLPQNRANFPNGLGSVKIKSGFFSTIYTCRI